MPKISLLNALDAPTLDDVSVVVDDFAGTPVSKRTTLAMVLGLVSVVPGGRLTLETGVPISSTNQTAKGTLYYTPYLHNLIRIWDGTRWQVQTFAEESLALTLTAAKNYDIFYNGTDLSLSSAWTNDTTRADALGTQDSVIVLGSDHTKLWLGTLYSSGTNTAEDSLANRLLSNAYNQVLRKIVGSSGGSHTYATNTAREWNAGTSAPRASFVSSVPQTIAVIGGCRVLTGTDPNFTMVVGIDDVPQPTAGFDQYSVPSAYAGIYLAIVRSVYAAVTAGRHTLSMRENAFSGTLDVDSGYMQGMLMT